MCRDKDHIHMNATAWSSLAGLCKFLGKEGKCVVEETDKGWFVQWIDRDPKVLAFAHAVVNFVTSVADIRAPGPARASAEVRAG